MSELIKREDAIKATWHEPSYTDPYNVLTEVRDRIEALPAASPWRRVEDELPPNAKHPGAFCPKYHILTKWGVTDGWFNPDVGENGAWRVLLWFFQGTWDEWDIDFERGDKPKLAWVSQRDVFAWMPIEPPKED